MANPKKREKTLMIMTGGIVVIFLMNMFVCGEETKNAVQQTVQKVVGIGPDDTEKALLVARMRNSSRRIQQINFKDWGKDPFFEAARITEMDSSWVDSTDFVLRGIIWKGNQAHALIGDVILKEGDRNGDLKVLNINKNSVVCRKGSRIVTLALRKDNE